MIPLSQCQVHRLVAGASCSCPVRLVGREQNPPGNCHQAKKLLQSQLRLQEVQVLTELRALPACAMYTSCSSKQTRVQVLPVRQAACTLDSLKASCNILFVQDNMLRRQSAIPNPFWQLRCRPAATP